MPEHRIGTREEWQAARDELAKLEAEQADRNEKIKEKRLALPWVRVEKEYEFDTENGKKTLAELFDGRSQLLAYNIMFGPDYTKGACPGCTSLGDGLDGSLVHLNHRDVTLLCFSRAPIERLTAYKERMGWEFPYVSTYNTEFPFDFGLALTEEQAQQIPEIKEMVEDPPDLAGRVVAPDRGRAEGRAARGPRLDRLRARERDRLPHLHREGARSVRRAILQLPARPHAQAPARRASHLPQGRVPGLRAGAHARCRCRSRTAAFRTKRSWEEPPGAVASDENHQGRGSSCWTLWRAAVWKLSGSLLWVDATIGAKALRLAEPGLQSGGGWDSNPNETPEGI